MPLNVSPLSLPVSFPSLFPSHPPYLYPSVIFFLSLFFASHCAQRIWRIKCPKRSSAKKSDGARLGSVRERERNKGRETKKGDDDGNGYWIGKGWGRGKRGSRAGLVYPGDAYSRREKGGGDNRAHREGVIPSPCMQMTNKNRDHTIVSLFLKISLLFLDVFLVNLSL